MAKNEEPKSVIKKIRFLALSLGLAASVLTLWFLYGLRSSGNSTGAYAEPHGDSTASTQGPDQAAEAYRESDRRQLFLGEGSGGPADRTPGAGEYVVRGRLTDRGASPLGGARLALTCRPTFLPRLGGAESSNPAAAITSDAEGLFELSYDPRAQPFASNGAAELVVTRDGYVSLAMSISLGLEVLDLGTLELPASNPWTGRVLEADGSPIKVSAVEAWNQTGLQTRVWPNSLASAPGTEIPRAATHTNAEGYFLIHGLDDGIEALLIGSEDLQFYVAIESATTAPPSIQAPVLMAAKGQIVDPEGGRLVDATILSLQETPQGWIRIGRLGVSDSLGNFEIPLRWQPGVALGVYTPGFQPRIFELDEVSLDAPLVVRLEPGRKRVVQVVDARNGAPVKEAELDLFVESSILIDGHEIPASALHVEGLRSLRAVDSQNGGRVVGLGEGRFDVRLDMTWSWILAATAEGFVRELIEESPDGDQVIRIPLSRGNLVRGRVLDKVTGEPCARAVVRILRPNNIGVQLVAGASGNNLIAVTDQQGQYRISGIPTGTFLATASSPGFTTAASDPIPFEETGAESTVDLRLPRNSIVHGEVHSLEPRLAPPYTVYVTPAEAVPPGSVLEGSTRGTFIRRRRVLTTDPIGRFEVADLSPGRWQFAVHRALEAAVWKPPSEGRDSSILALMFSETDLNADGAPPLTEKIVGTQPGETREVVFTVGRSEGDSVRLRGYLVINQAPNSDLHYIAKLESNTSAGSYEDRITVDEDGAFDFGLVPIGKGTIHVLCRSESASPIDHFLAVTQVELKVGKDQVVPITLQGAALVWFDTHDAETSTAISKAAVQFASHDLRGFSGTDYVQKDLAARILPGGHYSAIATAPGYVTQFVTFEVEPNKPSYIIPFPLTRVESQLTSFLDAGGSPLARHRIQIREIDGVAIPINLMPTLTTDDTGAVEMGVMPPSLYSIAVFDGSGQLVYEGGVDFTRARSEVILKVR